MPYQQGGTISEAVEKISAQEYVLPAIQREFVWRPEQICSLFDSVMQGYPFGEFLFWKISADNAHTYRYYGFVRDYHEKVNPHCPDLGTLPDRPLTAILDGQQRLTAFNIGLRGSMAIKTANKRSDSPDAYPRKVLAVNLLPVPGESWDSDQYAFSFVDESRPAKATDGLWYRVSDVLSIDAGPDMTDWLTEHGVEGENLRQAHRILHRLHEAIRIEPTICYFEEKSQDLGRVLNIFIRTNSGGTVLSYSDLLLSKAVSQWKKRDARKEVHELADQLNEIGMGFAFSNDFILKAGLMLADISSVGFKVENFTPANMLKLEGEWDKIRAALFATVELAHSLGHSAKTIRADSALLPIAYYMHKCGAPESFSVHSKYEVDRQRIKDWLTRSLLKASGIWGSGLDVLLTYLRDIIRKNHQEGFPAQLMSREMERRGKSLNFKPEEIDELVDMKAKDRRIVTLLSLLFPFLDMSRNFHVDHVFPKAGFTKSRLRAAGIPEEKINTLIDHSDRLGNLQLLEGRVNNEKRKKPPSAWLESRPKPEQQLLRKLHSLGEIPETIEGFEKFYADRCGRLRDMISNVLNGGSDNPDTIPSAPKPPAENPGEPQGTTGRTAFDLRYTDRPVTRKLLKNFQERMKALDPEVYEVVFGYFVSYRIQKKTFVSVSPQANSLRIFLQMPLEHLRDPKEMCQESNWKSHPETRIAITRLEQIEDLDYIVGLAQQSLIHGLKKRGK